MFNSRWSFLLEEAKIVIHGHGADWKAYVIQAEKGGSRVRGKGWWGAKEQEAIRLALSSSLIHLGPTVGKPEFQNFFFSFCDSLKPQNNRFFPLGLNAHDHLGHSSLNLTCAGGISFKLFTEIIPTTFFFKNHIFNYYPNACFWLNVIEELKALILHILKSFRQSACIRLRGSSISWRTTGIHGAPQ